MLYSAERARAARALGDREIRHLAYIHSCTPCYFYGCEPATSARGSDHVNRSSLAREAGRKNLKRKAMYEVQGEQSRGLGREGVSQR